MTRRSWTSFALLIGLTAATSGCGSEGPVAVPGGTNAVNANPAPSPAPNGAAPAVRSPRGAKAAPGPLPPPSQ